MKDDLLVRASRALRDQGTNEAVDGLPTLARIERSLTPTRKRRRPLHLVYLPLVAVFVGLGAWAMESGQPGRWVPSRTDRASSDVSSSDVALVRSPSTPSARPLPPPIVSTDLVPVSASAEPTPGNVTTTVRVPPPGAQPRPTALSALAEPTPDVAKAREEVEKTARPDADALFHEAHDLHFAQRDYARAVVAWDRYLALDGARGRFTLEARYSRAIALVRLGRREEAARALAPFAQGQYGGYRRDDASAVLRTLE